MIVGPSSKQFGRQRRTARPTCDRLPASCRSSVSFPSMHSSFSIPKSGEKATHRRSRSTFQILRHSTLLHLSDPIPLGIPLLSERDPWLQPVSDMSGKSIVWHRQVRVNHQATIEKRRDASYRFGKVRREWKSQTYMLYFPSSGRTDDPSKGLNRTVGVSFVTTLSTYSPSLGVMEYQRQILDQIGEHTGQRASGRR